MTQLSDIRLVLTDVDGVLTDGGMYYSANGDELKRFSVYDGMGVVLLREAGIPTGIITSEITPIVEARAKKLKIPYLRQGARFGGKREAAEEIARELGITLAEVVYIGDDVNCKELLEAVGYACCPPNARPQILAIPGIHVLQTPGGQGAFRELADAILAERAC